MKKLLFLILIAGLSLSFFGMALGGPPEIYLAQEGGEIQGALQYCGQQGSGGIEVHIPGMSLTVRTDPSGNFVLIYVPPGTYTLVFEKKGQIFGSQSGVQVQRRELTLLDPITLCNDLDGDGYLPDVDCDDSHAGVYPGAPELCGDGRDNNCNGETDESCPECTDYDTDTYYAQLGCGIVDCDDTNPNINPGAQESCDGIDNDCDGRIDEEGSIGEMTFYLDLDGDGYGDNNVWQTACSAPEGYISVGGDCNDQDSNVHPGATEHCNLVDDNCDGQVDEDCVNQVCTDQHIIAFEDCMSSCLSSSSLLECAEQCLEFVSEDCRQAIIDLTYCAVAADCLVEEQIEFDHFKVCAYDNCEALWEPVFGDEYPTLCTDGDTRSCGSDIGECVPGLETCVNGRWGPCEGDTQPSDEICDGFDNDCDGETDINPVEGGTTYYYDADGDGYGGQETVFACPDAKPPDTLETSNDCDDENPNVHPGAEEICDGHDNDCDGEGDNIYVTVYPDSDGDGFGDPNSPSTVSACEDLPPGFIEENTDCDDSRYWINPAESEVCDGWDNNCNGEIDEGC